MLFVQARAACQIKTATLKPGLVVASTTEALSRCGTAGPVVAEGVAKPRYAQAAEYPVNERRRKQQE
jgi:hypothetical protein